jgi:hypothetical protein
VAVFISYLPSSEEPHPYTEKQLCYCFPSSIHSSFFFSSSLDTRTLHLQLVHFTPTRKKKQKKKRRKPPKKGEKILPLLFACFPSFTFPCKTQSFRAIANSLCHHLFIWKQSSKISSLTKEGEAQTTAVPWRTWHSLA